MKVNHLPVIPTSRILKTFIAILKAHILEEKDASMVKLLQITLQSISKAFFKRIMTNPNFFQFNF